MERKKNTGEIYQNIFEKRFYNELERLSLFKHKVIVCQFEFSNIVNFPVASSIPSFRWDTLRSNGAHIISRITDIQLKYGVPFIFAGLHSFEYVKSYLKNVARIEKLI